MASKNDNFLEQFIRKCSATESALNTESAASSGANTLPAIVSLNAPTDPQTPTESNDSQSTRLLNGSRPQYSTIGVPVPANGQTIGPQENEDQMPPGSCCTFLTWYKDAVIDFRSSCYVYIFHFLIIYIPISSILVGMIYSSECPLISVLPILAILVGVVGIVFMAFGISASCFEYHATPCSGPLKSALGVLFGFLLLLVISEMYIVGHMSPNFDPSAEDYCNKTFYYYVIGKEVVTAAAVIISALIYFPGSSLQTCCMNIPAPSPASAFFSRL